MRREIRQIFGSMEEAKAAIDVNNQNMRDLAMELCTTDNGTIFSLDFLVFAAINRSLSLSEAVIQLLNASNYLAAASLVRLQLDSCMRLHAAWLVDDPNDFASCVLRGTHVRKLLSANGEALTDKLLAESLGKQFPWIANVYEQCSGFVHLSNKHVSLLVSDIEPGDDFSTVSFALGARQEHVGVGKALELATAFDHMTDVLRWLIIGWRNTKLERLVGTGIGVHPT